MDLLAADAHKWLLGPCGAGLLYVRRSLQSRVNPPIYGWHNVRCPDFVAQEQIVLRHGRGRSIEAGTHNLLGIVGLVAAMELLLELGVENIARELLRKRERLVPALQAKGYTGRPGGRAARRAAAASSPFTGPARFGRAAQESSSTPRSVTSLRTDRAGQKVHLASRPTSTTPTASWTACWNCCDQLSHHARPPTLSLIALDGQRQHELNSMLPLDLQPYCSRMNWRSNGRMDRELHPLREVAPLLPLRGLQRRSGNVMGNPRKNPETPFSAASFQLSRLETIGGYARPTRLGLMAMLPASTPSTISAVSPAPRLTLPRRIPGAFRQTFPGVGIARCPDCRHAARSARVNGVIKSKVTRRAPVRPRSALERRRPWLGLLRLVPDYCCRSSRSSSSQISRRRLGPPHPPDQFGPCTARRNRLVYTTTSFRTPPVRL